MNVSEIQEHKRRVKEGSVRHLTTYVQYMLTESQKVYNKVSTDHRYHQSRVNVLEELLGLLPKVSE